MTPVKGRDDSFSERIELLLQLLSPWANKSLTYGELAEMLGPPWTEDAVKGWVKRGKIAAEARERVVEIATAQGITGVTLPWLRGEAVPEPHKGGKTTPGRPQGGREVAAPPSGPPGGTPSSGLDLFEELISQPAVFTRRLDAIQKDVGKEHVCVFLNDAEKDCTEKHPEYRDFLRATFAEYRRRRGCSDRAGAEAD